MSVRPHEVSTLRARGAGGDAAVAQRLRRGMGAPRAHGLSAQGVTLTELLVAIAIVTIIGGVALSSRLSMRTTASAAADGLARTLAVQRSLSVRSGAPASLRQDGSGNIVRLTGGAYGCDADGDVSLVFEPPPRSAIDWPGMALAFAPDGRPRRCDGSAVGNTTILIEGPRGDRAAVIVASLGRVRWERR